MILPKKTQSMCIGNNGEVLQGDINLKEGELNWVNYARHMANLISWNLKNDDESVDIFICL